MEDSFDPETGLTTLDAERTLESVVREAVEKSDLNLIIYTLDLMRPVEDIKAGKPANVSFRTLPRSLKDEFYTIENELFLDAEKEGAPVDVARQKLTMFIELAKIFGRNAEDPAFIEDDMGFSQERLHKVIARLAL
jgi:hypothetical protein